MSSEYWTEAPAGCPSISGHISGGSFWWLMWESVLGKHLSSANHTSWSHQWPRYPPLGVSENLNIKGCRLFKVTRAITPGFSRAAVESLPALIPIWYVRPCEVDAWCGGRHSEASVKTLDTCGRPQQAKVSICLFSLGSGDPRQINLYWDHCCSPQSF